MGVALLQAYPVPQDKTAPQAVELLQKRILNLGATHTGQFLVDCETYYSSPALQASAGNPGQQQGPRILNVLHNSEQPATVFSVVESPATSSAGKGPVTFTCDTLFDLLLLKLGNVYSKRFRIESKGARFEVGAGGDFLVKLGLVSAAGSFRGILVEVEYQPCVVPKVKDGLPTFSSWLTRQSTNSVVSSHGKVIVFCYFMYLPIVPQKWENLCM